MIGSLKERVEILKPLRVEDGGGGYEIAYASLGDVPALAEGERAGEDRSLGRARFVRKRRFTIRRRDDIVFEMRLRHGGRAYRITDIQNTGREGSFTLIRGEEVTA